MPAPLVSIGVPTRNRANDLRISLKSICAQDYAPLEILISDNASEDDTEAVCRDAARADARIRYVRHARSIGLNGNHNFCMDEARGSYLCIMHDHDDRVPGIVSEYVDFLERHPQIGLVCSDWDLSDDTGARLGVREHNVEAVTPGIEYIDRTIRSGRSSIGIPGAMIRRSALGDIRMVPDAPVGFGDFPIWLQVAENWDIGHVAKRLWTWRQSPGSQSARPIVEIAHDYCHNIEHFLAGHLERCPQDGERVERWRRSLQRYLFWALAYEAGLHCRDDRTRNDPGSAPSLFEIMSYRLTPEQFERTLAQMRAYRTGAVEHVAYAVVVASIRLGLTQPLAWVARHQSSLRVLLRLT